MQEETLINQLKQIRDTGRTNMMDRNAVQIIANEMGFFELVVFIEDNSRQDYFNLLKQVK